MNTNTTNKNRIVIHGLPYVYVSYENNRGNGAIAVIDCTRNQIIERITSFFNPTAMCTDPSEERLYVTDNRLKRVMIFRTDDFLFLAGIAVGTSSSPDPVAVFVEPGGKKLYVANYGEHSVSIIDTVTLRIIKNVNMFTLQPGILGRPFAFTCNEKSSYVYVACKRDNAKDYLVALSLEDDTAYPLDFEEDITFGDTRNPLTVHPDGHTLVSLGEVGMLNYFGDRPVGLYDSISLLDNTVSGIYLDNRMLFCTTREDKSYLKVFKNLAIDSNRNITYENFIEVPSYKAQDIIRTSRTQKYIGVTVKPTDLPTGGVQVIDVASLNYEFIALDVVGDMTFPSDSSVYVGQQNSVRPIDLASMVPQPAIQIGGYDITVKSIISGYSNQSS
ncbi:YncE family protein [Paenibacillus piscarius]|uniref:YncE family protein n=1 Tax=Paenibacillus piscarius TaxID=1089681 RepID=UPI001EE94794|nr:hypothetical protein [Paenibacillus piscarius]